MAHAASAGKWDAGRGRKARSPSEVPRAGWRDILLRVKQRISHDRLSIVAAGVAFYALMAVFPALVALVALYGLAFDPQQVSDQMAALGGMLPRQAADILLGQLHDLVRTDSAALGVGAIVGALVALWSASAGVRTAMQALNVAYNEEEKRGFIRFYATALLLTIVALIGVALVIALIVALPIVLKFLGFGTLGENLVLLARWPIVALAVLLGLAILYRYGPSREAPRWEWVSHGALLATVLWLIGSILFSLYVSHFGSYNKTYGSAGAVVILLTWFLLSAYVVLIGAEINAESERQTRKDTTTGPEQPLGKRKAYAADTVGRTPP
ncbi:MAG TPA: YihY/virulence factor BrkB family protein [Burkholderiales bacterium]|nr:YihY/virulence factor BrkB family protein [Burkholderiales bacterium]